MNVSGDTIYSMYKQEKYANRKLDPQKKKSVYTVEPVLRSPGLSGHLCITAMVTRSQIFSHTNALWSALAVTCLTRITASQQFAYESLYT